MEMIHSVGWYLGEDPDAQSGQQFSTEELAQYLAGDRSTDPDRVEAFVRFFDGIASTWPANRRIVLIAAIESLVIAESTRLAHQDRTLKVALDRFARDGLQAARLADSLRHSFSAPMPLRIRDLIVELSDLMLGSFSQSQVVDEQLAAWKARELAGSVSEEITQARLAELVRLALGIRFRRALPFDEVKLRRRYINVRRSRRRPGNGIQRWKQARSLVQSVASLAKQLREDRTQTTYADAYNKMMGQVAPFDRLFQETIGALRQQAVVVSPPRVARASEPNTTHTQRLKDARQLRAVLTRTFQDAKNINESAYGTALMAAVGEHLPGWTKEQIRNLLTEPVKAGAGPSNLAARIVAAKVRLPLREVRAGRANQPIPRRRTAVRPFADLDAIRHAAQPSRRGHAPSRIRRK